MTSSPLGSIRVLDLSAPVGTYGGRLLASLGADVVLVEPPEGDPYRRLGPYRTGCDGPDASLSFGYYQAGKRSIVLDLSASDDLEVLHRLGRSADVVLVSPTPEAPVPGFDPATGALPWAAPNAIVCAVTPYGVTGPYSRRPATHLTSFAQGGQMCRIGAIDTPPRSQPPNIHWHLAGVHAAIAAVAALGVRDRVGGQFIDISAQEVEVYHDLQFEAFHSEGLRPGGRVIGIGAPPTGNWECSDGVLNIAAHADRHWASFLEMLDHPEELGEPSLADMALRIQIFDGLAALIEPLMAAHSRDELLEKGQAAGLPVSLLNTPADFVADEQLEARDFWVDLGRPEIGEMRAPGAATVTSPSIWTPLGPAPLLDEHGAELRAETRSQPRVDVNGEAPSRPLEGLRVLSLGAFVAGNTTAQILAGLGAEVVKLEAHSHPEVLRNRAYNYGRTLHEEPSGITNTPMYGSLSKGTLGVAIEMDRPEGLAAFLRLVRASDVVIENFGARIMRKWGCAYEDLRAVHPSLVMASLSGYGRTGPKSEYLAYASSIANFTGLTDVWFPSGTYTDYVTASHAALSILAAHQHRVATGESVYVDASQIEAFGAMAASLYLDPLVNGRPTSWEINSSEGSLFTAVVPCQGEDRWAAVEVRTLDEWNTLCHVLARPELVATSDDQATERTPQLVTELEAWAAARTAVTVGHMLCLEGIPAAAVAVNEEIYNDPQLHGRDFPVFFTNPDLGWSCTPSSPYRMSMTPGGFDGFGPRLGEHTSDVLRRWGGLDESDIEALLESGAAFQAPE